jgi:hypothetical protein
MWRGKHAREKLAITVCCTLEVWMDNGFTLDVTSPVHWAKRYWDDLGVASSLTLLEGAYEPSGQPVDCVGERVTVPRVISEEVTLRGKQICVNVAVALMGATPAIKVTVGLDAVDAPVHATNANSPDTGAAVKVTTVPVL